MSFPFDEEPITSEEERLIGEASGHLHDRCEQAIGTSKEDQVEAEHDAMMRLRRRHRQVEAALAAKDAEIAKLREALTFYSKRENWIAVETKGLIEAGPFKGHYQTLDNSSPAEADGGNRARAVLGEKAE